MVRRGHHGLFPGSWTPTERRGSWEWWGGPLGGSEEGQDQTFDGILSEDANSDKVRGVKVCKNPENFKNPGNRGSEACQGRERMLPLI